GRLAGARGGDQGDRLARPDRQLRILEDVERRVALAIVPVDPVQKEDRGRIGALGTLDAGRVLLDADGVIDGRVIHNATPRPDRGAPRATPDRASPAATTRAPSPRPPWSRRHRPRRAAWRENKARARTARCWSARTGTVGSTRC